MLKLFKIGFNLMVVCCIGGTVLALANAITAPKIAEVEEKARREARQTVLPQATDFQALDKKGVFFRGLDAHKKMVGYVILALAEGYGGEFGVMVGLTPEFKIVAMNVLTTKETPGLGDRIKGDKFRNQYKGKGVENLEIVKTPTEEKIQAITGATISSKAVTDGVKEAIEELKKLGSPQISGN